MRAKIIAVDFDGTLIEEGKWPGIGATVQASRTNQYLLSGQSNR